MSDSKAKRDAQLARLRALMAKTVDNGCSEAEAQSAAAAVDRLLGAYEIDMDEVLAREQEIVTLHVDGAKHHVRYAAQRIAAFTDCKVWVSGANRFAYFGFKVDTEIAEYLTALFRRAIDREASNFTAFNADYAMLNGAGQREMQISFGVGMASRLGDRLTELKSKRDFQQRTSGRDLVAIKFPLVQAAFDKLGISLGSGKGRGRSIRDTSAYNAGRSAADRVSINPGISGRGQAGGRLR